MQPLVVPGLAFGKGLKLESIVWLDPGDTADPNPIAGDVSHILPLPVTTPYPQKGLVLSPILLVKHG